MGYLQKLKEKFLSAPDSAGVYLMRDSGGKVLYVGKAKSLKKRLLSYWARSLTGKTRALMSKVADVEFRLAANEELALLLEFKLIHEFRPWYNVSLKDDKSFPFVKISAQDFPSLQIARKKNDLAATYLGPYTNAKLLKSALKIIRAEFPYRSCRRLPKESCIYQRIHLCPAPCIGRISQKEYQLRLDDIILILKGKNDLLIRKLTKAMQEKSGQRDFEAAGRIRDQIMVLSGMPALSDAARCQNELARLKERLNLKNLPARIEGFDISNFSGQQAVGSMVSFYNGRPDKNNYRRFRIKSVEGIDDYKMLAEVLRRRYTRLLAEKSSLPDLLLIDGGKGHLLVAARQLAALNLHIPIVSIAKPRKKACGFIRGREKENIYSSQPGRLTAVLDEAALNLIRRIRDEAHRFALRYHHLLRGKEMFKKC